MIENELRKLHLDDVEKSYDSIAETYHLLWDDWDHEIERRRIFFNRILGFLQRSSNLHILDCGCGVGTTTAALCELGHSVVALDISQKSLVKAHEKVTSRNLKASFKHENILDLSHEHFNMYDLVICTGNVVGSFLTYEDLELFFSKIKYSLMKNGNLVLGFKRPSLAIKMKLPIVIRGLSFRKRSIKFTIIRRKWVGEVYDLQYWFFYSENYWLKRKVRTGSKMRSWTSKELIDVARKKFFDPPIINERNFEDFYQSLIVL